MESNADAQTCATILSPCCRVVILDPSWNPSHDLQAQDRAYRLGQDRDVSVYRLVATGTIEETVYSRQVYKQQQANMAVEGATERRYFEGTQCVMSRSPARVVIMLLSCPACVCFMHPGRGMGRRPPLVTAAERAQQEEKQRCRCFAHHLLS